MKLKPFVLRSQEAEDRVRVYRELSDIYRWLGDSRGSETAAWQAEQEEKWLKPEN